MKPALILTLCLLMASPATAQTLGDASHGAQLYRQKCASCHAPDRNGWGPSHRGVFGRPAAAVPGYNYSSALRDSGLTWDAATLDAWLSDSRKLVPGTKMSVKIKSAHDRADLIAYLKTLH